MRQQQRAVLRTALGVPGPCKQQGVMNQRTRGSVDKDRWIGRSQRVVPTESQPLFLQPVLRLRDRDVAPKLEPGANRDDQCRSGNDPGHYRGGFVTVRRP